MLASFSARSCGGIISRRAISLILNGIGCRAQIGDSSRDADGRPCRNILAFLELREDLPPHRAARIGHQSRQPGNFSAFRLVAKPRLVAVLGKCLHWKRGAAFGGRGNERRAELVQFGERLLRVGELVQACGHGAIFLLLGIMIAVRGDRQMSQVERPQIAIEDFGSQGEQAIEEISDSPYLIKIARLVIRLDAEDSPRSVFVLQEKQRVFLEVRLRGLGVRQAVGEPDHQVPNSEVGIVQVEIVAAAQHLGGIAAKVAVVIFVVERPRRDLGP